VAKQENRKGKKRWLTATDTRECHQQLDQGFCGGNDASSPGGFSPQAQRDHAIGTLQANTMFQPLLSCVHHNGGFETYPQPLQNQTGNVNQLDFYRAHQEECLNGHGSNHLVPIQQLGYNSAFASNYCKFMNFFL